ncbi:glycosyltransferase family 2 protein [Vibrio fluvialis]|nr:glycosyltransferase family 2 protein [Vibrio fluvialis]MBY8086912.1 glycosyltransferase family 2 protein [Vibrio fluvialis]MBY8103953.1 glycosyltransferase family 2 protein [Vibrio fluvialis]
MISSKNKVGAIVVTYNPDVNRLKLLIERLIPQVCYVVIVDNGSKESLINIESLVNETVLLKENFGIATAQNIGIKILLMNDIQDVILFDQDSIPSESMVSDLLTAREHASKSHVNIAAVGPLHIDQDDSSECVFVDTHYGKVDLIVPRDCRTAENSFVQCDFLIASGCLISAKSLELVGLMEDDMFIDCVDIEWGYRARSKGLLCIAALHAKMYHKIGDQPLTILGRKLTTHSPVRHYYFYRNFYSLLKRSYIPSCWKRYTFVKSTIQVVAFSLFLPPRFKQLKYIIKGIFHGVIGRKGKYE